MLPLFVSSSFHFAEERCFANCNLCCYNSTFYSAKVKVFHNLVDNLHKLVESTLNFKRSDGQI